jgi:2-methylcitrate dehydratase PrpD
MTHPVIDAIGGLRAAGRVSSERVARLTVHIGELEQGACAIPEPEDALEVKFSVAHLAAMALLDRPLSTIADEDARDPEVVATRSKVDLALDAEPGRPYVEVRLRDGSSIRADHDSGVPAHDLGEQRARLAEKFMALAQPVIGASRSEELLQALEQLAPGTQVRELLALTRPTASG